jgi:hypothetical protein
MTKKTVNVTFYKGKKVVNQHNLGDISALEVANSLLKLYKDKWHAPRKFPKFLGVPVIGPGAEINERVYYINANDQVSAVVRTQTIKY